MCFGHSMCVVCAVGLSVQCIFFSSCFYFSSFSFIFFRFTIHFLTFFLLMIVLCCWSVRINFPIGCQIYIFSFEFALLLLFMEIEHLSLVICEHFMFDKMFQEFTKFVFLFVGNKTVSKYQKINFCLWSNTNAHTRWFNFITRTVTFTYLLWNFVQAGVRWNISLFSQKSSGNNSSKSIAWKKSHDFVVVYPAY